MVAFTSLFHCIRDIEVSQILSPHRLIPFMVVVNMCYLLVASRRHVRSDRRHLMTLLFLLLLPMVYLHSGIEALLGSRIRSIMLSLGWYDQRHVPQLIFMLAITLIVSGIAVRSIQSLSNPTRARFGWAFIGGSGFILVSLFQAISLHEVDLFFSHSISTWQYHNIANGIFVLFISKASLQDGIDFLNSKYPKTYSVLK